VATHYKDGIVATMNSFIDEYYYPALALIFVWEQIYWIWEYTQPERFAELKGIVKTVDNPKLNMAEAVLLN